MKKAIKVTLQLIALLTVILVPLATVAYNLNEFNQTVQNDLNEMEAKEVASQPVVNEAVEMVTIKYYNQSGVPFASEKVSADQIETKEKEAVEKGYSIRIN